MRIVKLTPPPRATAENIVGFNFGIRPYRKGGIRLEKQEYKSKTFYHNYGHGGAGVSLTYGCARRIIDIFQEDVKTQNKKPVAVIGSGYMGLIEANLLADMGFEVTVYAKAFPKSPLGMYDTEACIVSQVAGGLWMPFGLDIQDKPLHFLLGKQTYDYYRKCMEEKKYKGLSYKPVYIIDAPNPILEFCPPDLIDYEVVKIDFGNGKLHEATHFTSILIDGDVFLNELYNEAKQKGVSFVQKDFNDILDLCELKENHIFNCTGSYSSVLFNDTKIHPIVGHLLYLKKQPEIDYFLSAGARDGKNRVTCYPHSNKLAIGLTYEERGWLDKPDPESVKKLISNLNEFHDWRIPSPKL